MNKKAQVYYVILGAVILLFSILMAVVLSIVDPLKTDGGLIVFFDCSSLSQCNIYCGLGLYGF